MNLYDRDILAWSEEQAELLRRRGAPRRRYSPSMARRIDVTQLYRQGRRGNFTKGGLCVET